MNKIGLVIAREYLARVRKKSFLVMTILGPFFFAAVIFIPAYLATTGGDEKTIAIIDESGFFENSFQSSDQTTFEMISSSTEEAKGMVRDGVFDGLLVIPPIDIDDPRGVSFYASSNPSLTLLSSLSNRMEGELENTKLRRSGIDKKVLESLKVHLDISTINLTGDEEKETSSIGASAVGYMASFLIYIFIFIYGAQCMRGVIEEKTSRIIEVVISSIRPFQLMMGKVIGIAGVGLTQFVLWVLLTFVVVSGASLAFGQDKQDFDAQRQEQMDALGVPQDEVAQELEEDVIGKALATVSSINLPMVIVGFLFFFLSGYLLYGALFAGVGSAVDSDADAQQFMFPVTVPLIISIVSLSAVLNDPHGSLSFWMSMIPFTSPVVMMMRIPFGVPAWQLALSMLLMVGGFVFTIWVASRIYRVGILMHGTKVNYRILAKWFMMKN